MLGTVGVHSCGVLFLQLETEQKSNFATAARLRDRLEQLAARLQVSAEEIQQFNTKYTGFRPKVIQVVRTLPDSLTPSTLASGPRLSKWCVSF